MPNYPNPHDRPPELSIWLNDDGTADIIARNVYAGEFGANACTFRLTVEQVNDLLKLGGVLDEGQARRLYEWKEARE